MNQKKRSKQSPKTNNTMLNNTKRYGNQNKFQSIETKSITPSKKYIKNSKSTNLNLQKYIPTIPEEKKSHTLENKSNLK